MPTQAYELWYERFKPQLSLTPYWDGFDRAVMAATRNGLLNVVDIGASQERKEWSKDCQPEAQWRWLTELGAAKVVFLEPDADLAHDLRQRNPQSDVLQKPIVDSISLMGQSGELAEVGLLYCGVVPNIVGSAVSAGIAWPFLRVGALVAIERDGPPKDKVSPSTAMMTELGARTLYSGLISVYQKVKA